jgi:hypothetical protein
MDIVVEELLNNKKFDICIPLHNGVWQPKLDLVCGVEDCDFCEYIIWKDYGVTHECYYSSISEERVTKHLVENKPKILLSFLRDMKLPEINIRYWHKEIQKFYPLEEYPELWI